MPKYRRTSVHKWGMGFAWWALACISCLTPASARPPAAPSTALLSVQMMPSGEAQIGGIALKSVEWVARGETPEPDVLAALQAARARDVAAGRTQAARSPIRYERAWLAAVGPGGQVAWTALRFHPAPHRRAHGSPPSKSQSEAPGGEAGDVIDVWDSDGTLWRAPSWGTGTRWFVFAPRPAPSGGGAKAWTLWLTAEAAR